LPVRDARQDLSDTELLAEAARTAGEIALGFFRKDPRRWTKDNDSPVSEADIAVDRHLAGVLQAARPDYGWLSEETADDRTRLSARRSFVVDPIDGTRGFLSGSDEGTVALSVIDDGRPVAAVVYRPASGDIYRASLGSGLAVNGSPAQISGRSRLDGASLAGPKAMTNGRRLDGKGLRHIDYVPSLALRLAMVAAGQVDVAVARENACDWDLAAADLLVQEAGGRLEDLSGAPLAYNRPSVRHPALLAGPPALLAPLRDLLTGSG
jgi:myo-inositol-1(or 4)-monophosphatase